METCTGGSGGGYTGCTSDGANGITCTGKVAAALGFSSSGPYASSGATQAKPAFSTSGSLLGWFDSTDLIPEWENSSGTTVATAIVPKAARTAHRFLTNVPSTGVQADALIDVSDLPTVTVAYGGTGLTTQTAHALYAGNTTSAPTAIGPDASTTKALFSAGASADPAFRAIAAADLPTTLTNGTAITSASLTTPALGVATGTSLAVGGGSIGTDALEVTGTATHNGAVTLAGASLVINGNISSAAWTTNGLRIKGVPGTLSDTTSNGTVAAAYTDVLGGNTITTPSNTVTFTDYFTMYAKAPVAGTHVTLTNGWGVGGDSMKIGTSNPFTVSTAGAVNAPGGITGNVTGNASGSAGSLSALAGMPAQAADTIVMNATGGSAAPTAVAMPTCTTGAVLYNTSTHAWSCVSVTGGVAPLVAFGSSDTINAAGAFATTISIPSSWVNTVGNIIHIEMYGLSTTTATSTPLGVFTVKWQDSGTHGNVSVCTPVGGRTLLTGRASYPMSLQCTVAVSSTGASGVVLSGGFANTYVESATSLSTVNPFGYPPNSTIDTTSTQIASFVETSTMVTGQTFTLVYATAKLN